MSLELVLPGLVSAIVAKTLLSWWLTAALRLGFAGRDMNKPGERMVAEAGGIWVVLSSGFGVLLYIAIEVYTDRRVDVIPLLSIALTLLMAGLLGFFDDILGWKRGINPIKRVLFTLPISLPLVAVKAGHSVVELPVIGTLDLGLAYSLLVVPAGVVGASNAFNMIAGYNGLEALQGLTLLLSASLLLVVRRNLDAVCVALPVISSITVFYLLYNRYPAKMFPGNSFTYGIGAFYASLAIYWNFEKYAIYSYALYFLELVLFVRGLLDGVYKENFGRVQADGSLLPPYEKSYSVTHLVIKLVIKLKGKCYETDAIKVIVTLQAVVCALALSATFLAV
ncbi:MAG: glycosyl transferase family 4 [Desulfurococcaceae archaeon]